MRKAIVCVTIFLSLPAHAGEFISGLGKTFTDAFDKDGLIILGVGAAATAIAFSQDQAMHDAWVNHQHMSADVSRVGDVWGQGYIEGGIAVGQLFLDKENGLAHTEALIASTAVVYAMKYGIGRERPYGGTFTSFPSGHTQFSFATATSLTMSYGWGVGVPFYGMAVFTGLSRIADNAHWLSDVVAGATIGILFGRSAHKRHMEVLPVAYDDGGYGLQVSYHF